MDTLHLTVAPTVNQLNLKNSNSTYILRAVKCNRFNTMYVILSRSNREIYTTALKFAQQCDCSVY